MTRAQLERLAVLTEELGEALHMVGKTLRHGFESTHKDYNSVSNKDNLVMELGHVKYAIELMVEAGDIDGASIKTASLQKWNKPNKYLHYQNDVISKRNSATKK